MEKLSAAEKRSRIFKGDEESRLDLAPKARELLAEIEKVAKELGVPADFLLDCFRDVLDDE